MTINYEKLLALNPGSEETLLNMISLGLQQKDYASVKTYSEALLQIRPDNQTAMEGLSGRTSACAATAEPDGNIEAVSPASRMRQTCIGSAIFFNV